MNSSNTIFNRRKLLVSAAASAVSVGSPWAALAAATQTMGFTLPLTGPQAEVAKDLRAGYEIAFKESPFTLKFLDDQSKAELAAENMAALAGDSSVLATSGVVGTPHAAAALPFAVRGGLPVVGIRSGAQGLRKGQDNIFHLRSSYEDELDKVVGMCKGAGFSKMALLYSDDLFGTGSRDHLTARLKEAGIAVAASVPVSRNGENMDEATAKIANVVTSSRELMGVALLLILKPMTAAAQSLRVKHQIAVPLFSMSFVSTKSFSLDPSPALRGLGMVTAFPLPRSSSSPLTYQYRQDVTKAGRVDLIESLTAFESYFYGQVMLKAATGAKSRDAMIKNLKEGLQVANQAIRFDSSRVGYRFLEIVRKDSDGRLRA